MADEKILISACLLGNKVRYDGAGKLLDEPIIRHWQQQGRLVPFCPEVEAGMPIPRPPAEIQGGTGAQVLDQAIPVTTAGEEDLTRSFIRGANLALSLCQQQQIKIAIMTEGSPSCGSQQINDGSFQRRKIAGEGVTVALLRQHGIRVFNQHQLDQAKAYYCCLTTTG